MNLKKLLPLLAIASASLAFAKGEGKGERGERPRGGKDECPDCAGPRGAGLTDEEKTKLKAAHEAAEKDPAFIKARDAAKAAHEKAKESKSKEDREAAMAAGKAAREAHRAAMLKADPTIADILAKVEKARGAEGEKGRPGKRGPKGDHGPKGGDKGEKPAAE